jgi:hypothetical protein
MRGIQNNFANLQINQFAMEQAAIQAAKDHQAVRARAEAAEAVLKQKKETDGGQKKSSASSRTNPNGQKKSNTQNFKNPLHLGESVPPEEPHEIDSENSPPSRSAHIDFKA